MLNIIYWLQDKRINSIKHSKTNFPVFFLKPLFIFELGESTYPIRAQTEFWPGCVFFLPLQNCDKEKNDFCWICLVQLLKHWQFLVNFQWSFFSTFHAKFWESTKNNIIFGKLRKNAIYSKKKFSKKSKIEKKNIFFKIFLKNGSFTAKIITHDPMVQN